MATTASGLLHGTSRRPVAAVVDRRRRNEARCRDRAGDGLASTGVDELQTSVTCTFTFEAAHRLAWHPGRCRNLHGHSYRLDVTVRGPVDDNGVVVDFDRLTEIVDRELVSHWDHQDLNEVIDNPTAELLAQEAWKVLAGAGLRLAALRLWETGNSWVEVTAGGRT